MTIPQTPGPPDRASPDAHLAAGALPDGLEQQISGIEQRLEFMKNRSADELADDLRRYGTDAVEAAEAALSAGHRAILYAWATGSVFNLAKEALIRGRFGAWLDSRAAEIGIKRRTAQYWMKLAADCCDVRAFLVPGASLSGVYRKVGILSKPESSTDQEDGKEKSSEMPRTAVRLSAEPVFKFLSEGRKRLRHLIESGTILDDAERDRLEAEKSQYLTLFDELLPPTVP